MGWLKSLLSGAPEPGSPAETPPVADAARTDREAVASELCGFIAGRLDDGVGSETIERDKDLYDVGYLDSMRGADFLVFIEKRYGVAVQESDLIGALHTVDALADHVSESAQ